MDKTFKHSGNLGDIIYSLPTIIALGGGILYLNNRMDELRINKKAPLPPSVLTADMMSEIIELLKLQPCLSDVRFYNNEPIDFDLDKFREFYSRYNRCSHLAYGHLNTFGVKFNLNLPWLENIKPIYVKDIIVNRSVRNLSPSNKFNYSALRGYEDRCVFIGFDSEYKKFLSDAGLNIQRHAPTTILEFAGIIKGSRLFVGNQSLGFALAEAMKHPRALEISYLFPNCLPQSMNGHIKLSKGLVKRALCGQKKIKLHPIIDKICASARYECNKYEYK